MSNLIPVSDSSFDSIRRVREDGSEYWSARDLMQAMGYSKWQNFSGAVDRAKAAISNQNIAVTSHVTDASKLVERPQGGAVSIEDFHLTRYGCYILFMNGDPRKPEVAAAQAYFAVKTREAEVARPALPQTYKEALVALLAEVEAKEKAEALNAEMRPKALFADAVSTSKSEILVGELAKILRGNGVEVGGTRLFAWLRENGFLIARKGTDWNMPTQRAMELELFRIKETTVVHSDGHTSISKTPKVTGRGQQYFVARFLDGRFAL